jgi:hypothetical protein
MNANNTDKSGEFKHPAIADLDQQPRVPGAGQRTLLETRRRILAKLSARMSKEKYFCAFDGICSNLRTG